VRPIRLFALFLLASAGLPTFGQELRFRTVIDTGLQATFDGNQITYSSQAVNKEAVGDTPVSGAFASLVASFSTPDYGGTLTAVPSGNGGGTLGDTFGWYIPFEGLKIEAGTSNDNPFPTLDTSGVGLFASSGIMAAYTLDWFSVGGLVKVLGAHNVGVIGATRIDFKDLGAFNLTVGTAGTEKVDWIHGSAALLTSKEYWLNGGYAVQNLAEGNRIDTAVATVAWIPVLTFGMGVNSTAVNAAGAWDDFRFAPFTDWIIVEGFSILTDWTYQVSANPTHTAQVTVTYRPFTPIAVQTYVRYAYSPNPASGNGPTSAVTGNIDFLFTF
jgi:hypothetical protein